MDDWSWRRTILITWMLYAGAIFGLAWAVENGRFAAAIIAAIGVAVSGALLNRTLRRRPATDGRDRARRVAVIGLLGVAPLILDWIGVGPNGMTFLGFSSVFFAMGLAMIEVRATTAGAGLRGPLVVILGAALIAAAIEQLSAGDESGALTLGAGIVVLLPVGLSLLSGDVLRELLAGGPGWSKKVHVVISGAVLLAIGWVLLIRLAPAMPWFVLPLLVLLVGAVTSDTDWDIVAVVVLAAILLAWAAEPRSDKSTPTTRIETGEQVIVALGDSFMSGEGASRYYEGTNVQGRNTCRRAPTAYPVVTVELQDAAIPNKVVFIGCSGAKAENIHSVPQHPGEPIRDPAVTGQATPMDQLANLAVIREEADPEIELVILSVGGNDGGFGHLGDICVRPGDCSERGGPWLERLNEVERMLRRAFDAVRGEIGKRIPVLVVPYPIPLDEDGCTWSALAENEHRYLNGFTHQLNEVVRSAARWAGFHVLDDMETALEDAHLRICDDDAGKVGVNFLAANPVEGFFEDRTNPANWFHNSLHPNSRGHAAMSETLAQWIRDHPGVSSLPRNGKREFYVVETVEDIMEDPDFLHCGSGPERPSGCQGTDEEWAAARLGGALRGATLPALAFVTGAWMLWIWILMLWHRRGPAQPTTEPAESGGRGA